MDVKIKRKAKIIHILEDEKDDLRIMSINLKYGSLKEMIETLISKELHKYRKKNNLV